MNTCQANSLTVEQGLPCQANALTTVLARESGQANALTGQSIGLTLFSERARTAVKELAWHSLLSSRENGSGQLSDRSKPNPHRACIMKLNTVALTCLAPPTPSERRHTDTGPDWVVHDSSSTSRSERAVRGRLDPYGTLAQMEFFSWEPNIRFSRLLHPGM
eukprot:sb/3472761/